MSSRRGKRWPGWSCSCPWVFGLTCSSNPSYLVTMDTTVVLVSMTMLMKNMPGQWPWIRVVLISSQCHQRKQQGGKGNFDPSFFRPICLAPLCKVWMANVSTLFAFGCKGRGTMSSFCTDSVYVGKGAVTRM